MDANVAGEVFIKRPMPAAQPPTAGEKFLKWINRGDGHLVVGGKLLKELDNVNLFREWAREAQLSGKMHRISDKLVDKTTANLQAKGGCRSNDPHVIALAQVSGSRLLYTNDRKLQHDFSNKILISSPQGKVYETLSGAKKFTDIHKGLLSRIHLCPLKR
ncbi:MAG: hypothetical protein OXI33_01555 [Chloroflexota bacterium]|nr:hypothetical protein [Chloroflexota bacterium]